MEKKNKTHRVYFKFYVNKDVFEEAKEILETLNLTMGEAMCMLCNQIALHRKLPFEMKAKEKEGDRNKVED